MDKTYLQAASVENLLRAIDYYPIRAELLRRFAALEAERDEAREVLIDFVANKDFIKSLCKHQLDYPHMVETFDAAWKLVGGELESPIARTAQPPTAKEGSDG